MTKYRTVTISVEVCYSSGPRKYDDDDALASIESELDGNTIYAAGATDDETELTLNVLKIDWDA